MWRVEGEDADEERGWEDTGEEGRKGSERGVCFMMMAFSRLKLASTTAVVLLLLFND